MSKNIISLQKHHINVSLLTSIVDESVETIKMQRAFGIRTPVFTTHTIGVIYRGASTYFSEHFKHYRVHSVAEIDDSSGLGKYYKCCVRLVSDVQEICEIPLVVGFSNRAIWVLNKMYLGVCLDKLSKDDFFVKAA